MGATPPLPLHLDHVSVAVPHLAEALDHVERRLGLRASVSAADPSRHSRVHLDGSYLEVSTHAETTEWRVTHFFLRFEDPRELRTHLDACGFTSHFGVFDGVDGRWDDVEIVAGSVPLPILIRRTHPPDVARGWPPPLVEPHRCGARKLVAVHVAVPEWEPATTAYRRLLGLVDLRPPLDETADGSRRMSLPLASGHVVLVEAEQGGLVAFVLGVESMNATAEFFGGRLTRLDDDAVAWLDPLAAFGLRLGFVEI